MSTLTTITPKSAPYALIDEIKAGLVPFLKGSPGIGKSDIIKQVAKTLDLKIIDIRLAQADPTDLAGFPVRNPETNRMEYAPLDTIPLEGDTIPINPETNKQYQGFLIVFEEITSAPPAVQAASYKIILDRLVNQTPIHPSVAIVAAGNLETDRAIVVKMSTALKSRFAHLQLETNLDEWLEEFAFPSNIDSDIISFLRYKPDLLHHFDPDSAEDTFPCPRTWEFVDKFIKSAEKPLFSKPHHLLCVAGMVGQGAAFEFKNAKELFDNCPSMDEIVKHPDTAKIPEELSQLYSISTLLSSSATEENLVPIMTYIDRIPLKYIEYRVLTVQDILKRKPELEGNQALTQWMLTNAKILFGKDAV